MRIFSCFWAKFTSQNHGSFIIIASYLYPKITSPKCLFTIASLRRKSHSFSAQKMRHFAKKKCHFTKFHKTNVVGPDFSGRSDKLAKWRVELTLVWRSDTYSWFIINEITGAPCHLTFFATKHSLYLLLFIVVVCCLSLYFRNVWGLTSVTASWSWISFPDLKIEKRD